MRQLLELLLGLSCSGTTGVPAAGRPGTDRLDLSMRLQVWIPALLKSYHQMPLYAGQSRAGRDLRKAHK